MGRVLCGAIHIRHVAAGPGDKEQPHLVLPWHQSLGHSVTTTWSLKPLPTQPILGFGDSQCPQRQGLEEGLAQP